jgi:hypothetical protein
MSTWQDVLIVAINVGGLVTMVWLFNRPSR